MKQLLLAGLSFFLIARIQAQPADTSQLLQLKAPMVYHVQMNTTVGQLTIEVNRQVAPLAADRFYQLVSSGFYNDSRLFRSNKKYLQFGIGNDSAVNAFWDRHPINDEPVIQKNVAGSISFATAGPNTRTTSVYFNKIDNPKLDTIQHGTAFPSFGKVVAGDSLLAVFENKYEDSVVFKHWDAMTTKGNAYTDRELPGLDKIINMRIVEGMKTPADKQPARKTKGMN